MRWAPPESAVRTERRNGKAEFIVLVAAGGDRSASARASIAPAAASTMNSALPLRRSVRTALSGGAQRVYSQVGARTPTSSQRPWSVSQGSLISATLNPTYSLRGSPESPQFLTPTGADLSLSPWPRARSVAGNFEAHSPLGNLRFSSPDRQPPTTSGATLSSQAIPQRVFCPTPLQSTVR